MVSVGVKHHVHLQDRPNSPSPSGQSYCCLLREAEFWEFTKLLNITDEMEVVSSGGTHGVGIFPKGQRVFISASPLG